MDDDVRTVSRVRTESVTPTEPVVPAAAESVYIAEPAVYIAEPAVYPTEPPVYAAAPPVYAAAPPVYAAPQTPVVAVSMPVQSRPLSSDRVITERESVHIRPSNLEMSRRIVSLAFGILQGLLILRIVLLLLVANRENDIVQLILNVTSPFVNPFRDMFAFSTLASRGSVLDVAAIVALIAWTLVELLVFAIINLGGRRRTVVY
jgi:uncharacterized protein YggT (Ycf19 family)